MSFSNRIVDFGLMSFSSFLLICYGVRFPQRGGSPSHYGGAMPHNSGVVCLNCGHSIQLPSAMRPKTGRRQEARATDTIPLLLACPSCGHVYEYTLPRFLPGLHLLRCGSSLHGQQPHSASPGFAKYRLGSSRSVAVEANSISARRAAATRRLFSCCGTCSHAAAFGWFAQPKSGPIAWW